MFRKYEKTKRFNKLPGKINLSDEEMKGLLGGEVIVEEKMDGANIGIIRHKDSFSLQKRGSLVGQSEHEQFGFFHNWANVQKYEQLMSLPKGHTYYGELLFAVHTVEYDALPDYVLIFDIWDGNRYLKYDERAELCSKSGLYMVPLIARGNFTKEQLVALMPEKSAYGPMAEGMVFKRYTKHDYHRAKLVKPEFVKTQEEADDWMTYSVKRNKLANVV